MSRLLARWLVHSALLLALATPRPLLCGQAPSGNTSPQANASSPGYAIKTTVRRVVVDVVATKDGGLSQTDLTAKDFSIEEDGKPQRILSFDAHSPSSKQDSWSATLPPNVPPNTFINLPRQAEDGPLYLLFYDMVHTGDGMALFSDYGTNMFARQQLIKFVNSKQPGTRFALIVLSDGLHLVQGFTNDQQLLLKALDPHGHTPHMPQVFLYSGQYNFGYVAIMKDLAHYLDGYSGRKNIIWVSKDFPFAVFADSGDAQSIEDTQHELSALAADQISIYPIDAGGVHDVNRQDLVLDEVADETGGHAYYGGNGMADSINKAVNDGATYYTVSYTSTNPDYNGKLRHIEVKLGKPGYHLSYRRQYYADPEAPVTTPPAGSEAARMQAVEMHATDGPASPPDTLYAYIRHGAPMSHGLLFSAHVVPVGEPKLATVEQMADLSDEPAYFRKRHKNKPLAPLPPVPLQSYQIEFDIPSKQFRSDPATRDQQNDPLEFASAAYNAEGYMLNGKIGNASPARETTRYYPAEQEFDVPTTAAWLCLAVRDPTTGRIGNIEISLPLASEAPASGTIH